MANAVVGYDPAAIKKMFSDYVVSADGKNRHTMEANQELGLYSAFTAGAFRTDSRLQDALYERMMNCAVEFEESGFIAGFGIGFRCALSLVQSPTSPVRPDLTIIPPVGEMMLHEPLQNHKDAEPASADAGTETAAHEIPQKTGDGEKESGSKDGETATAAPDVMKAVQIGSISSRDIAKMFDVTHRSIICRIENVIMPDLDEDRRAFFRLDVDVNRQHRKLKVYRLNKAACEIYLDEMEMHKKYINVAGGLIKMRELMKAVFPEKAAAS